MRRRNFCQFQEILDLFTQIFAIMCFTKLLTNGLKNQSIKYFNKKDLQKCSF